MNLREALGKELLQGLPGEPFHRKMFPVNSPVEIPMDLKATQAAVALIIHHLNNTPAKFLLIKRSEYQGYHSGQISLPGGKADIQDKNLLHTAIRETFEEIGIRLLEEEYIGQLTPLFIHVSGFNVTPYIFYVEREITFCINKEEVNYLIEENLEVLEETSVIMSHVKIPGRELEVPCFNIKNEVVWGATSMILSEFAEILRRIRETDPAA